MTDGKEVGWQAKFIFDTTDLIAAMRKSLVSANKKRKGLKGLTFCIPWDLADDPSRARGKQARERYEEGKERWARVAPGVEIDLLSGGHLLERLALERHRGREWFFFSERLLGHEWCEKELAHTIDDAGDRYTPQQNVELPVDRVLEAVAQTSDLECQLEERLGSVLRAGRELLERPHGGWDAPLAEIEVRLSELEGQSLIGRLPPQLATAPALDAVEAASNAADRFTEELRPVAWPEKSEKAPTANTADKEGRDREMAQAQHLSLKTRAVGDALWQLRSMLDGPSCKAAERRALFVEGPAGRGKTHLFCDVAERLLADGHPVVAVLGQRFRDPSPWRSLAQILGEPNLSPAEIANIFAASGEASGRRAVLLIDALNEATDPTMWASELAEMRRRLTETGWVGFAVSCRSTYLDLVEPPGGPDMSFVRTEHLGYQGREFEAIEKIFTLHGLQQPRVPLLLPEFSNPLFLKLYCEGIKEERSAARGADHLSAVFERFAKKRSAGVERRLRLDHRLSTVAKAIAAFAGSLAEAGTDRLEYEKAHELINGHAPHLTSSPDTLLEAMVSEGLLAIDRGWNKEGGVPLEMVSFPYQRFSDHLIVGTFLIDRLGSASRPEVEKAFQPEGSLNEWLRNAPGGLIEALAIQLPERWQIELPDLIPFEPTDDIRARHRSRRAFEAFLSSLALRDRTAFDQRATELINTGLRHFAGDTIEALVAIAPDPDHPHNALRLHDFLSRMSMPERDSYWTRKTYDSFGYADQALDRLIRWAARGPYPQCPDEVVELASVALTWSFASPNRFSRDYAIKALATLTMDRAGLHAALVNRFSGVDDPYVTQGLAAAVAGAVTRDSTDCHDRKSASRLLDLLISTLIEAPETTPDLLTRDYIATLARWMRRRKLIPPRLLERATPPYGSKPPKIPRRASYLETTYPRTEEKTEGYGLLLHSALSSYSDWSRYVVSGVVDDFLPTKLGDPVPESEPQQAEPELRIDAKAWRRFEKSLDAEQGALLTGGEEAKTEAFVVSLTDDQRALLSKAYVPRRRRGKAIRQPMAYPPERACRFIFQRVIELGWTPERFGELDWSLAQRGSYRTSHKAERFGKKYQWIALNELLARLADNFTLSDWNDVVAYQGAWQLRARNLDPTLPPEMIEIGDELETIRKPTFPVDKPPTWWSPLPPTFDHQEPGREGEWANLQTDLPTPEELLRVSDDAGSRWAILNGHHDWREDPEEVASIAPATDPHRDIAILSAGAFIHKNDVPRLGKWLNENPDLVRSLPDWGAQGIHDAYWAELPEECRTRGYDAHWRRSNGDGRLPVRSAAVSLGYLGESGGRDCSISETVSADLPSRFLAKKAGLRWSEAVNGWVDDAGNFVVQYRETDEGFHRDRALMMDERRLALFLNQNDLCLVVGLFCERRVFDQISLGRPVALGWVDYAGHLIFDGNSWKSAPLAPIDRRGEMLDEDG